MGTTLPRSKVITSILCIYYVELLEGTNAILVTQTSLTCTSSLHASMKEVNKEAKAEVKEAIEFCLQGSELPPHELYTHVYVNQGDLLVRGCDPFTTNQTVPRN